MSIFSRRKIEIDPEDHELVTRMSEQSSETSLFQTEAINITKITQELQKKSERAPKRSRREDYRPSRMSDSFMSARLKPIEQTENVPKQSEVLAEYRRIDAQLNEIDQVRKTEVPQKREKKRDKKENRVELVPSSNVTSQLDQKELTEYMQKTHRINRLMVSLIVAAIVIVAVIVIVVLILNLRKSGQTSPLGGV